ncbi:MAG: DegV family protein [SAR202 cluster bacterium]|nr:DegV family protein [SAR202 cluster bacterium]MDP6665364.1 DegV family protein [SAR202 cluster bacterium]
MASLVVDSAASLPADVSLRHPTLRIVPMRLTIGGVTYDDGKDITTQKFYELLQRHPGTATTSAPSPAAFLEAFEDLGRQSRSILCIVVAERFSSAIDSARSAGVKFSEENPDHEVCVMDSLSAAGGQGLIALEALKLIEAGKPLTTVVEALERVADRVRLLAFVDTLYYLWKGGRVPMIAHAGARLLHIKPTFELHQAQIATVAKPRSTRKALDRLVRLMKERVEGRAVRACIMHAAAEESAHLLHERIKREFDCRDSYVTEFTPVMGAHLGPGMVGVGFLPE